MSIRRTARPTAVALLLAGGAASAAGLVPGSGSVATAASETAGAIAAPGPWVEDDMERAIRLATSSGRYLLIDFTGSDWCGWCIKLDQEVFDHRAFIDEASKDFVFAKLDFPRKPQPEEIKRKNREWQVRLGVRGFPTIFLADAQGRPFAQTGYRPGGPGPYLEHLKEFVQLRRRQEQLIEAAMKVEGLDRARGLGEALAVPKIRTPQKDELVALIRAADPEDSLGLVARFAAGGEAGEAEPKADPKTPFEVDLEAVSAMIKAGDTDQAAGALRRVQQRYRPAGARLADWGLVRMEFLAAIGRPSVAVSQADRILRTRDVPAAARQRVAHRKAEMLLADGKGAAALAAWDAAVELNGTSELAKELRTGREAFAAACRAAGG